jgi:hypothetical protein
MTVSLRVFLIATFFAVFSFLAWQQAGAWIFRSDPRIYSHHSMVGQVTFDLPEGTSNGTAFFVSDCEVLTNFHVAFGPSYVTVLRAPSSQHSGTFELTSVKLADGGYPKTTAIPVAWGDFAGLEAPFRRPAEDWALLTLGECLGSRKSPFELIDPAFDDDSIEPGNLMAVGYSSGRQMTDPGCSIRHVRGDERRGMLLHDCVALQGDSGAPMVRRGTNRAVGIITAYRTGLAGRRCDSPGNGQRMQWSEGCANLAVPLSIGTITRIRNAVAAIQVQRELLRLGYDAGRFGDIGQAKLSSAIRSAQSDMGFVVTGEASHALTTVLCMRNTSFKRGGL